MRLTEDELRMLLAEGNVREVGRNAMPPPPSMTEAALQHQVREVAMALGWELIYHTHNSKRSDPGFPDLVLCRPGRLLFVEMKTEKAVATPAQQRWLDGLGLSVPGVERYLWRPSDLPDIPAILRG